MTETRLSIFGLVIACMALMIGSALAQGTDVEDDSEGDRIVSIDKGAAAEKLAKDDEDQNLALSKYGAELFQDGDTIMTICNTGALATYRYGTAFGSINEAFKFFQ